MAGSLQDQLLKAGLVSRDQVSKAEKDKRQQRSGAKGKKKAKAKRGGGELTLEQAYARRARTEQADRDRELNRKREEAKLRKEMNRRLEQLIRPRSLNDEKAELSRFFEWSGKIRKLHVNAQQQKALNDARLGITHLKGRFFLVEAEIIDRVKEIKPDAVAFYAPDLPDNPAEDDIPDDLVW
jgi:uncharacterized protein YaiL (DUF2058 family)